MTTIYTTASDQLLVATVLPILAQNNVESVRLFVEFDEAWDGYSARSAVFTTSLSSKPHEVTLSSGFCLVPQEVLAEPCRLYIAVKGVNGAGKVKSSTRLTLKVSEGAPSVVISDPTPSVYHQLAAEGAVLSARMSALETAGTVDGSEIIGVRTGADGTEYPTAGDAVRDQFYRAIKSRANKVITSDNYATDLPDLDEAAPNTIYNFLFASNLPAESLPANIPFDKSYGAVWLLLTVEGNAGGNYRTQLFINHGTGEMWTRYYGASWSAWQSAVGAVQAELANYLRSEAKTVTSDNYANDLPDLNDAPINSVYRFLFASNLPAESLPANLPMTSSRGTMWSLITLGSAGLTTYSIQIFINHGTGEMWTRLRGGEWGVWSKNGASVYYMTSSENLLEVLLAHQGDTVYVPAGDYDIIQVYKEYAGENYFDTYEGYASGGDNIGRGLPVYNGTALICSPAAKFTCHYKGNNANVAAYFSAFATGDGFTLDGLRLETSGVRYAIHDDFNGSAAPYKSTIKNCYIRDAKRAIGGGMGTQGIYEITGNYFGNDAGSNDVAYHNNARAGRNHLSITGNYFENNLSLRYYGASTTPTECLVSGNSFGKGIEMRFENDEYANENIKLIEWGNIVNMNI